MALSTSIDQTKAINPWLIAITVTLATFMELLDTAIANVSLPHIAGGLATSYDESTWVLTSYLVANAVVLPLSAWLSRVFGRKNYYMGCVALFSASSMLCGLAPSLGLLIIFRVLQGIAGGGLAPVEQAILVDTFPASKRAAAFALYSMAIVTAPAIAVPVAGLLSVFTGWAIHKPMQLHWLTAIFGDYDKARIWHFWLMWIFILFVVPHVILVLADGWDTLRSMIVGWSTRTERSEER
jgi:DHA2 family multidrug resistance protein